MRYSLISFDLQGTLSEREFSDRFWLELLPEIYSEKYQLTLEESKQELKNQFQQFGRYDARYYDFDYWLQYLECDWDWQKLVAKVGIQPQYIQEMVEVVTALKCPLLLFSATTHPFIEYELGVIKSSFQWILSAIEDLKIAGKTPAAYRQISGMLGIPPDQILHVGDDLLMDVQNARFAGWNAFHYQPGGAACLSKLIG